MGHFKSNVRDIEFNLFEVFGTEKTLKAAPFQDVDDVTHWERVAIKEESWFFPEKNARGDIVGLKIRLADGNKSYEKSSVSGLCYPDDWTSRPGPVLLVEGGSDVAAGLASATSNERTASSESGDASTRTSSPGWISSTSSAMCRACVPHGVITQPSAPWCCAHAFSNCGMNSPSYVHQR